jgi:predicted house-cleaning noncanonical NTP pyrophosphatase (MazG superfamily)
MFLQSERPEKMNDSLEIMKKTIKKSSLSKKTTTKKKNVSKTAGKKKGFFEKV